MQEKDQVQEPKAEGQSKKPSFDESYEKGWEQVELLTAEEAKAAANAESPQAKEGEDGKPNPDERKPFKVLKVQGKEVPVYSEDELIELAQKGVDYTKKTQTLAEDRRQAESELKKEEKLLSEKAKELNATLDEILRLKGEGKNRESEPKGEEDESGKAPASDAEKSVYEEYGIDPRYAQPHEIKIVKDLAAVKEYLTEIKVERADRKVREIVAKEREAYPYEDIIDDQGQNIAEAQIASIVNARKMAAEKAGEKPDPITWVREAVREVSASQKKTREAFSVTDETDPEVFASRFPKLAASLKAKSAATIEANRAIVPPSLPARKREPVFMGQLNARAQHPSGKSLDDYIEEGFNDPETIKALTGG